MAPRVAIDANILIAGIVWPRWPHEVLNHAMDNDFRLVLSPLVIQEARRRLQQDFPDLLDRLELFLLAATVWNLGTGHPAWADVKLHLSQLICLYRLDQV